MTATRWKSAIILALMVAACVIDCKDARALLSPPGTEPFFSATAYAICDSQGGGFWKCSALALAADPVGSGITDLSVGFQYDAQRFKFNSLASGFLCQFSSTGECPPAAASIGQTPLQLLPATGFAPGLSTPGSTVSLTDTGSKVDLQYHPGTPVTADVDTNFFLFTFDFDSPIVINLAESSVTYSDGPSGADFTQTDFACSTVLVADQGCGGEPGISGISLNLVPAPEPDTSLIVLSGLAGLFTLSVRRRRQK